MKPCLLGMVTYNRLDLTKESLTSLLQTASPDLYELVIVDNASTDGTVEYLKTLSHPCLKDIFYNEENLGTAGALNMVWEIGYDSGQHVGKIDNDMVFYDKDWLDKMYHVVEVTEDVAIVGLKRRDLEEKPNHNEEFFRTRLFTLPGGQVIEISHHVMGNCWLVSYSALRKLGALVQIGPYGLDDSLYCLRAKVAGLLSVFVPDVSIEHIDPGHPKYPQYTQWKIDVAGEILRGGEYQKLCDQYQRGERGVFESFT